MTTPATGARLPEIDGVVESVREHARSVFLPMAHAFKQSGGTAAEFGDGMVLRIRAASSRATVNGVPFECEYLGATLRIDRLCMEAQLGALALVCTEVWGVPCAVVREVAPR